MRTNVMSKKEYPVRDAKGNIVKDTLTGKPVLSKVPLIDSDGNLVLNADTWTEIKGKIVTKTIRAKMPSKNKVFDKKGNLKISKRTYDALVSVLNEATQNPLQSERNPKTGKYSKKEHAYGLDKLIDKVVDNSTTTDPKTGKTICKPGISADEEVLLSAILIKREHMSDETALLAQGKAKSGGVMRTNVFYEVQDFLSDNSFDADEVEDDNIEEILAYDDEGDIKLTDEDRAILEERLKKLKHEEDEPDSNQTITPTRSSKIEQLGKTILRNY